MFTFGKLTEQDEKGMAPLDIGDYEFIVDKAIPGTSKKGDPQIYIELCVYDIYGNKHIVKDWLTASDAPLNKRKIKEFCHAVGMADKYESGQFDEYDIVGKRGKFHITQETHEKYGLQHKVGHYIYDVQTAVPSSKPLATKDGFEDDVPF